MATFKNNFGSLLASVAANCEEIGSYIHNTDFIVTYCEGGSALHDYDSSTPLEYLKGWCWTRSWDKYFSYIVDLWDEDQMSGMRLNALIERLSAPAARLDVLVPKLEKECQRLGNVPESVIINAREMHTCVNSFLNSADDGLNLWKKNEILWEDLLNQADILVESEIRRRRPIIRESPVIDEVELDVEAEHTKKQLEDGTLVQTSIRRYFNSVRMSLASDLALLAMTGIISIVACIIQGQAFSISIQLGGKSRRGADDPDFYNALQTFLMQTLALYTVLAPALRSNGPRYEFWRPRFSNGRHQEDVIAVLNTVSSFDLGIASCSSPTLQPDAPKLNELLEYARNMRHEGIFRRSLRTLLPKRKAGTPKKILRTDFLGGVHELVKRSSGCDLPGTFNPLIVRDLCHQQSKPWKWLVKPYTERILDASRKCLELISLHTTAETTIEGFLREIIHPSTGKVWYADQLKPARRSPFR
ncbi:MAG: hypothetical protein Q9163_002480 [Psora crenata]